MNKVIRLATISVLLAGANTAVACDDKSCESAYISAVQQYVTNHQIRANSARNERMAYAKVRENRDRDLIRHIRSTASGRNSR